MKRVTRAEPMCLPPGHTRSSLRDGNRFSVGQGFRSQFHPPRALVDGRSDLDPTLELIVAGATSLLPAHVACLRILDEENDLRLVAFSGLVLPRSLRVGVGFSGLAAKNRTPVVSLDCCSDARLDSVAIKRAQDAEISSFVAVPILAGTTTLGVLAVGARKPTHFTHAQIKRLSFFANQSANALQNVLSDEYPERRSAQNDCIVDDLRTRLARVEQSLAARDQLALALSDLLGGRDKDRGHPKTTDSRTVDSDNLLATNPLPFATPAELLLYQAYRSGELARFIDDALDPLFQEDERHGLELVVTLASYLENCCNMAKTAKRLFVHHNTIKYRLQRCEELGHFNLEEAGTRFRLQLALRVARMAGRCHF